MNTSFTIRDGASGSRTDSGVPDDAMRRLVDDAVEALRQGQPGILLIGPPARAATGVGLVLQHLRAGFGDRLVPVRVSAAELTPSLLRRRVEQVHAGRIDPSAWLLLVIEEANALSPDLLAELEMAADAAAELGGLQFLFSADRALLPGLTQHGLPALSACLATGLQVPEPPHGARPDRGQDAAADQSRARLAERRVEPDPSGLRPRILIALLAIAVLVLVVALGIGLQGRRTAPVAAPAAPPQTPAAGLAAPPVSMMPAPVPAPVPAPASIPAPASMAPGLIAPPPPAPDAGSVAAPPVAAPTQAPVGPVPQAATPAPPAATPPAAAPSSPTAGAPPPQATSEPMLPPPPAPDATTPASSAAPLPPPESSLVLVAEPGDTLQSLYARVYHGLTPPPFADVAAANPGTIRPGTRLIFPAPPGGWRSL